MKRSVSRDEGAPHLCERLEPRVLLSGDGRPTALLLAPPVTQWSSTYVFRVVYSDDVAVDVSTLNDTDLTISGPNQYLRRARFWRATPNVDSPTVIGWYKISAPGDVWDASDNGAYTIKLNAHEVRDIHGNSARARTLGAFAVDVLQYPSIVAAGMPIKGIIGVDVTRFGAIPDDGIDDTVAIQRAIDSLPRDGDGVPDAGTPIGGTVTFPKGTFNTSAPLRVPTAVRLRGVGPASVIFNSSSNTSQGAIELYSYSGHGFNIRAGVENLSLTTTAGKGVYAQSLRGDLVSLRLHDLTISAGGTAIDLRNVRAYQLDLRNVTVKDPGSTALWIGPSDWVSNVNRISGFNVIGTARAGFVAERAMVVLGGDISVEGLTIGATGASVTPLYASGSPVFRRTQIFATENLPASVLARFENCALVDLDRVTALGSLRRIEVRNTQDVRIGTAVLADGAALTDSFLLDAASHVTIGVLRSLASPGSLSDPRFTVQSLGAPDADPTPFQSFQQPVRPVSQTVADVRDFGAVPDDGIDDTAAIQAAVNWLPRGDGLPKWGENVGGLVLFSAGVYNTSGPIMIPSGVWLRGQGQSTVIRNASSDSSRGAVEFVSTHSHGFNAGAAIEDMSIWTASAMGIRAHEGIVSALVDARISGLQISAGSRAMDFSAVRTYHSTIQHVMVSDPGSTALWLGDREGYSAGNRVIGLQMQGTARPGFRAEKALIVLGGEYLYQNGWIEHPFATVLPLSISGSATIRGLWLEYEASLLSDGIVAQFENTTRVYMDRLTHVDLLRRLRFVNARNIRIDTLDISGVTSTLRDCIVMDATSQFSVGMVIAQRDSGLLDHPRVQVESAYNMRDRILIPNRAPSVAQNLLLDPNFDSLSGKTRDDGLVGAWSITWGDSLGAVYGSATVEQTAKGPRLKIVVTSNPNNRRVAVAARLNLPPSAIGQHAIARWRIDGSGQAEVYASGYTHQYSARAMNTLTSSRTPTPLRANEQIIFLLPSTPGVYYLSSVSLALT